MTESIKQSQISPAVKEQKISLADVIGGMTGAAVGIPQSMAFSLIAGLNPVHGLYTAFVSTIVGSLTSSSIFMTISTTNALALAVGGTLADYHEANMITVLVTLTVMIGIIQLVMGLLKLGSITRYVSNAVMTGFISGAGLLIVLGQLKNLTGIQNAGGTTVINKTAGIFTHLSDAHTPTLGVALLTVGLLIALSKTRFKAFSTLVALVAGAGIVQLVGWQDVALVRDVSLVPGGLPAIMIPDFGLVADLAVPAVAIALLGLVQSAGISQNIQQPEDHVTDVSQDFISQGAANIVGGFFQALPAGGSLSRTAVGISSGAKTRFANVIAGIFVGIVLISVGWLAEYLPMSALAGVLVVSAVRLIDFSRIKQAWVTHPAARISMLVTFAGTLLLPLEYAIYLGVILSLILYIRMSSQQVHVMALVPRGDGQFWERPAPAHIPASHPLLLTIYGSLYFGAIHSVEEQLPHVNGFQYPVVIIRLHGEDLLGSTFIRMLERYAEELQLNEGKLMLCGVSKQLVGQLSRTGTLNVLGVDNVFPMRKSLLESSNMALSAGKEWLRSR